MLPLELLESGFEILVGTGVLVKARTNTYWSIPDGTERSGRRKRRREGRKEKPGATKLLTMRTHTSSGEASGK